MEGDFKRPDPETLLKRLEADDQSKVKAKLKIFFGYAPGVGKTYSMLWAAQQLKSEGVDVVVGCVETHGRGETEALLAGMETIPQRVENYRGVQLKEFDLEKALERKPSILLVDELAHTNAPGSRHAKRWQDVKELLDEGINVYTTLNVQHIESLVDVVAQITWIRVRETVPDEVLDRADDIELVDIPPDELTKRLSQGKVYIPEQSRKAVDNFFRKGNLLSLRELALRRTAQAQYKDIKEYRELNEIKATWPVAESIMVCVSPSPTSDRLVRAARRMAAVLQVPWIAAYVEPLAISRMSGMDKERLESHLRLAESLGGDTVRLTGANTSEAILDYARDNNVTRIIMGKPTHPRLRDLIRGSVLDSVVRGSGDIDIYVISGDVGQKQENAGPAKKSSFKLIEYIWATALIMIPTILARMIRGSLEDREAIMMYFLLIVISAVIFSRWAGIYASILSAFAYDFFFIEPYDVLTVQEPRIFMTFMLMIIVGFVISGIAFKLRQQELDAMTREERTAELYKFTGELGTSINDRQVASVTAVRLGTVLKGKSAILKRGADGNLEMLSSIGGLALDAHQTGLAEWVYEHLRPAGLGTETLPGTKAMCVPIELRGHTYGVFLLVPDDGEPLDTEHRHTMEVFLQQTAQAFERIRLVSELGTGK